MRLAQGVVRGARQLALKISKDWLLDFASMLAYSLLVAFFPIALALVSITGMVLGHSSHLELGLAAALDGVLPEAVRGEVDMVAVLNTISQSSGLLGLVSLAGLIWSGAGLFGGMEDCFAVFFRVPRRSWLWGKLMALGMVLLLAVLAPLMVAASSLPGYAQHVAAALQVPGLALLLSPLGLAVGIGLAFVLFLCCYLVVPNLHVPLRPAALGASVAAVLFTAATEVFPFYLKTFTGTGRYGSAAAFALVIELWFWLFSLITLLGAEITAFTMGLGPLESDLAGTLCAALQRMQGEQAREASEGARRRTTAA